MLASFESARGRDGPVTNTMTESYQAGVGTAHLSSELDDDGPYTIHGVALGAGDVTLGSSGIKKKWPGDELEQSADTLEGKPLVRDHQNNSEGTVGTVTRATYREGVGVLYEAEIAPHYEELAKDIASGILEVSARAYHAEVEELDEDEETGALEVENVMFDNLSVVSQGASSSNTAEIGEAATMAQGPDGSAVAVMEQGSPRMDAAELAEAFDDGENSTTESDTEEELTDGEFEELVHGAKVLTFYGTISEGVPDDMFSQVVSDLSDHDALTAREIGENDDKIVAIVDISEINNVDDLNEHIVSALDETPFAVHDDYNWLDRISDGMADGEIEEMDSEELKSVAGVTFDGMSDGKLDESEIPNDDYESHYLFPDDTKSDSSYPVVDGEGNLRKGNVDAAHQLGARGGVGEDELKSKLLALNEEWPEDERPIDTDEEENEVGSDDETDVEEASDTDEGDDHTVTVATTIDDDARNEMSGQSTDGFAALRLNDTNTHMTDVTYEDVSDDEIEDMDDPVVIEQDDVEDLRSKAERAEELDERLDTVNSTLDELASNQEALEDVDEDSLEELREYDDARVLSGNEYDELQGLVDEIGGIFADELADYSPFDSEELQDRFTPMELREKVEEHDEAAVEDELGESGEDPDPEGGSASTEELEEGSSGESEELSEEEEREYVASELEEAGLTRQAEKVRQGEIDHEEILGTAE